MESNLLHIVETIASQLSSRSVPLEDIESLTTLQLSLLWDSLIAGDQVSRVRATSEAVTVIQEAIRLFMQIDVQEEPSEFDVNLPKRVSQFVAMCFLMLKESIPIEVQTEPLYTPKNKSEWISTTCWNILHAQWTMRRNRSSYTMEMTDTLTQIVVRKMLSLLGECSEEFKSWIWEAIMDECETYVEMRDSRREDGDARDREKEVEHSLCPLEILIHLLYSIGNINEEKDTKKIGMACRMISRQSQHYRSIAGKLIMPLFHSTADQTQESLSNMVQQEVLNNIWGVCQQWFHERETESMSVSLLIIMHQGFFPSFIREYDLRLKDDFWVFIQNGLLSKNPGVWKRALYLMKRIVDEIAVIQVDRVDSWSRLFKVPSDETKRSSFLRNVGLFLEIYDSLENPSFHLMQPSLTRLLDILPRNGEMRENGMVPSWFLLLVERGCDHAAGTVFRLVATHLVRIPWNHHWESIIDDIRPFVYRTLKILLSDSLFLAPVNDWCARFGSEFIRFYRDLAYYLPETERNMFLGCVLEFLTNEGLSTMSLCQGIMIFNGEYQFMGEQEIQLVGRIMNEKVPTQPVWLESMMMENCVHMLCTMCVNDGEVLLKALRVMSSVRSSFWRRLSDDGRMVLSRWVGSMLEDPKCAEGIMDLLKDATSQTSTSIASRADAFTIAIATALGPAQHRKLWMRILLEECSNLQSHVYARENKGLFLCLIVAEMYRISPQIALSRESEGEEEGEIVRMSRAFCQQLFDIATSWSPTLEGDSYARHLSGLDTGETMCAIISIMTSHSEEKELWESSYASVIGREVFERLMVASDTTKHPDEITYSILHTFTALAMFPGVSGEVVAQAGSGELIKLIRRIMILDADRKPSDGFLCGRSWNHMRTMIHTRKWRGLYNVLKDVFRDHKKWVDHGFVSKELFPNLIEELSISSVQEAAWISSSIMWLLESGVLTTSLANHEDIIHASGCVVRDADHNDRIFANCNAVALALHPAFLKNPDLKDSISSFMKNVSKTSMKYPRVGFIALSCCFFHWMKEPADVLPDVFLMFLGQSLDRILDDSLNECSWRSLSRISNRFIDSSAPCVRDAASVRVAILSFLKHLATMRTPTSEKSVEDIASSLCGFVKLWKREEKHCYMPGSVTHRKRTGLLQMIGIIAIHGHSNVQVKISQVLWDIFHTQQQNSIREQMDYLQSFLIVANPECQREWIRYTEKAFDLRAQCSGSFVLLTFLAFMHLPTERQKDIATMVFQNMITWTGSTHKVVRFMSHLSVCQMLDSIEMEQLSLPVGMSSVLDAICSFTKGNREWEKLESKYSDSHFCKPDDFLDESRLCQIRYSDREAPISESVMQSELDVVCRARRDFLDGISSIHDDDESWTLYLPNRIGSSIQLGGICYPSYSGFEEQFKDVADEVRALSFKAENVQRKITPWSEMAVEEEFDDRYGQLLKNRQSIIVCASLIDRVPNLAGITRTCEIFRAELLTVPSSKILELDEYQKICVSANRWMPTEEVFERNLKEWILEKRAEGYAIVGVEQSPDSVTLEKFIFPKKTLLLLGNRPNISVYFI
eukprot:TRINITY_DN1366_c0_g1_i2.p1 TRINITY_DN1366_c0_g1~~TRINITY_DN1366_c0_g1_i2.p1  ORF type:complete len:1580 (-),score=392.04 TRINITY_DN1366_c0_g1_i2:63-4736(-)